MKLAKQKTSIYLLSLGLGMAMLLPPPAGAKKSESPFFDAVLSISQLEETLSIIDELMEFDPKKPFESPTNMLRVMIQGTNWIDPSRSIIIGVKLENPKVKTAVLIPYSRPHRNFRAIYKPVVGPNFYFLSLPPHDTQAFPKKGIEALLTASKSGRKESLYLNFNPSTLLNKKKAQIERFLAFLKDMPQTPGQNEKTTQAPELDQIIMALMDKSSQLESVGLGFDLTPETLISSIEAKAHPNTELFALFSQSCKKAYLFDYHPRFQINVRSCGNDLKGMIHFMDAVGGEFYKQIGFDFSMFAQINDKFSGEMAGGISLIEEKIDFEMMMVLARPDKSGEFLVKEYLPWLMNLNHQMTVMLEEDAGQKIEPVFIRTKDTKIEGHRVIGFKIRPPLLSGNLSVPLKETLKEIFEYEVRMTTKGNLLLSASDDIKLHRLILKARGLKPKSSNAPLIAFDINMSKYIQLLRNTLNMPDPPTEMGPVSSTVWMADGQTVSTTTVQTRDIKTLIAFYHILKMATSVTRSPKSHL